MESRFVLRTTEPLDSAIIEINSIDASIISNGQVIYLIKLSVAKFQRPRSIRIYTAFARIKTAETPPLLKKSRVRMKHLDSMLYCGGKCLSFCCKNFSFFIQGHTAKRFKLPFLVSSFAPLHQERSIRTKLLNTVIPGVSNKYIPQPINGNICRRLKFPLSSTCDSPFFKKSESSCNINFLY